MSSEKPVILVVDDDRPILILMRNLLREFGFEPLTASTGAEAIDAARIRRPDLVLLDRHMPGLSGDEVIRMLRSEPELAKITIVILSGEAVGRDELSRIDADGAIQKPFDVIALVEAIRVYVNGKRA